MQLNGLIDRVDLTLQQAKNDIESGQSFTVFGQYGDDVYSMYDIDKESRKFADKAVIKLKEIKIRIQERIAEREAEINDEIKRLESDTGYSYTHESIVEIDGELFVDSGYGLKQVADLNGNIAHLYDGGIIQLTDDELHELEHPEEETVSVGESDSHIIEWEQDIQNARQEINYLRSIISDAEHNKQWTERDMQYELESENFGNRDIQYYGRQPEGMTEQEWRKELQDDAIAEFQEEIDYQNKIIFDSEQEIEEIEREIEEVQTMIDNEEHDFGYEEMTGVNL